VQIPIALAVTGGSRSFSIEMQIPCAACDGSGAIADEHVCPACGGVGHRSGRRTIDVRIPAGVRHGAMLRLRGLGDRRDGAEPGDLYLTVELTGDGTFQAQGDDLVADLPLAPWEAALGAKVPVRTPTGSVTLTVPARTAAGTRLRVKGQGLVREDGQRGDLYVRVRLELPADLTAEQVNHLRSIAESGPPPVHGGARGNGAG
jgi:DnaJ-class molecular chaperone